MHLLIDFLCTVKQAVRATVVVKIAPVFLIFHHCLLSFVYIIKMCLNKKDRIN